MSHPRSAPTPGSELCALACAAVLALILVPTASAAQTAWPKNLPGLKHLHFETAPIDVKPGQNSVNNVVVPKNERPSVDGYIVKMRPDLQYLDGTVPPVDVIHLHHGVWLNGSGSSPAGPIGNLEPIFFGGEEKTVFHIPRGYGYAYKASDNWVLNEMIHNNTAEATKVRLVWDLDFIPASSKLAKTVTPVTPLWMDVRRGWGYPVFNTIRGTGGKDGTFTFPDDEPTSPYEPNNVQNEYTMPWGGTIVSAVGHLHPGGLRDDIDLLRPGAALPKARACRRFATRSGTSRRRCVTATKGSVAGSTRIFRSQAHYYDPAGPVSWDVSLTASRPDWRVRVRKGDTLRITSTYDNRTTSWYENMGIVLLYVARGDTKGVDPFAKPVDWRGELTHGHLHENDNHGGSEVIFPDARKVAASVPTAEVKIKGFRFLPGDLGTFVGGKGKVPVVPQGQSLAFLNEDDPNVEWHSITTCAAPCNRSTGISYPLANGPAATQFDSGQLGFGPVGFAPAANRITWETPPDLPTGTYTYFCRIHNFMRGAFRVQ